MLNILAFSATLALLSYFASLFLLKRKGKDLFLAFLFVVQAILLFSLLEMRTLLGTKLIIPAVFLGLGIGLALVNKDQVCSQKLPIALVSILSILAYLHASISHLTEDKEILKITLTGNMQTKLVEWKTPQSFLTQAEMTCYEVLISTIEDKPLWNAYVYGDFCAIRCKIIRLHPFLNRIGFSNLYHLDAVYNGYRTAEDYRRYPVEAASLAPLFSSKNIFKQFFWKIWSKHFNNYHNSKWIKSATLESNYFPLTQSSSKPYCGSFLLTITPGGLSSIPFATATKKNGN